MNFNDIQKVNALLQEKTSINRALDLLKGEGRINAMIIGLPQSTDISLPSLMAGVTVPTAYIEYPSQMVDAIKSAFQDRQQKIVDELEDLGITGLEEQK